MESLKINKAEILKSFNENKEWLEKRNAEGIEKYRKGDFVIKFSNDGKKKVTVKQTKHKFLFGCNAFMLNSFEKAEKEPIYKEKFAQIFNQAVVPFYWSDLEPEEGKLRFHKDSENIYRRPAPDIVLDFCKEYEIEPKGHCLVWNHFTPQWLEKYSKEERKTVLEKRFKEISQEYADKIPSFDIVNEAASNYRRGKEAFFDNYDEYALALGGKYFPNNRKILNETNEAIWRDYRTEGKYMAFNMQLKEFTAKGLPIDEIGLQYHIFTTCEKLEELFDFREAYLNAKFILEILDIYDEYNYPMHISEITIPGNEQKIENEELQAEIAELLYTTWFATRNMKSIVWWNLVDGYGAGAPLGTNDGENVYGGGLLRFDMSEKPVYKTLDRLINQDWHTSFEKEIDGDELSFRGFYGEYEIKIESETGCVTKRVKFHENGAVERVE